MVVSNLNYAHYNVVFNNIDSVVFMRFKRLFLIVLFSATLMGCAHQGDNSNYFSHLSESNQKKGMRYLLGYGVRQDNQQAFYYFLLGAKEGDALSQNEIAYLYAAGKGTSRSYSKSFYWYKEAAKQGLASAQYNLGLMYQKGLGVKTNVAKAREWYQKSAARGFKPAIVALKQNI